jgi:hypothetical protein
MDTRVDVAHPVAGGFMWVGRSATAPMPAQAMSGTVRRVYRLN